MSRFTLRVRDLFRTAKSGYHQWLLADVKRQVETKLPDLVKDIHGKAWNFHNVRVYTFSPKEVKAWTWEIPTAEKARMIPRGMSAFIMDENKLWIDIYGVKGIEGTRD